MTWSRSSVIVMPAAARSHLPVAIACPVSMVSNGVSTISCFEAEVLGHQVDQVDVEADDLAALVGLERLVGQVGADGELAVLDHLDTALGGDLVGVVGAGAEGEAEGGDSEDGGQGSTVHTSRR